MRRFVVTIYAASVLGGGGAQACPELAHELHQRVRSPVKGLATGAGLGVDTPEVRAAMRRFLHGEDHVISLPTPPLLNRMARRRIRQVINEAGYPPFDGEIGIVFPARFKSYWDDLLQPDRERIEAFVHEVARVFGEEASVIAGSKKRFEARTVIVRTEKSTFRVTGHSHGRKDGVVTFTKTELNLGTGSYRDPAQRKGKVSARAAKRFDTAVMTDGWHFTPNFKGNRLLIIFELVPSAP